MPGPNSAPNGDTSLVKGHINEDFMCELHSDKHLDECEVNEDFWRNRNVRNLPKCRVVSKRDYLAKRNRLHTGKTK